MENYKEQLLELVGLCWDISNKSVDDVFISYSPHVNGASVYYYPDGYQKGKRIIHVKSVYFDLDVGGAESLLELLRTRLASGVWPEEADA